MTATGGSIESVTYAGREFAVIADADASRDLGGFTNEVQANGNGTARKIMTRKPWKVEGLTLEIDDSRNDQEFLQENADSNDFKDFTMTLVSGITYQGLATLTGDFMKSEMNASAGVAFSGPQTLTQQ